MRILIDERGKKYLVNAEKDFQSDLGIIKKEALEEAQPGDTLLSHLSREFKVIKSNVNDFIELMERRCSILLPKDIGIVISYTGLGCGDRVVDAGTGAGAIALHFSNVVGEKGMVYSYEIREDFSIIAQKNLDQFGIKNIELKNQDVKEGIKERDVDLIFFDLPKPWEAVDIAFGALKTGGWLAVYAPYIEQVQLLKKICKNAGFENFNILECILREIEVKVKGTRPKTRMVGHTGYLVFSRKL